MSVPPIYLGYINVSRYVLYGCRRGGVILCIFTHTEVCISVHVGDNMCVVCMTECV